MNMNRPGVAIIRLAGAVLTPPLGAQTAAKPATVPGAVGEEK